MQKMLFALFIFKVSADYLVSWDKNLNPSDIYWPSGWVDNILTFSSNHAGDFYVKLTVHCNILVDLPIGTYIQLTLPGFGTSPYQYSTTLTSAQLADNDNMFTIGSITMPTTAGAYGPISLLIMQGSTGQIIGSNVGFGYAGVTTAMPISIPEMTVAFTSGASKVVSESTSLTFTIPLNVPLQAYDYLMVSIDMNFAIGSLTAPVWTSSDSATALLFNTTAMSYTAHTYDASGSIFTSGYFMIYGLQQNVNTALSMKFTVGGFSNPKYVGVVETWQAKFMRWGTGTILQRCVGVGPAANIPGNVTGIWVPTNGYIHNSQIVKGTITYMTLAFSFQHYVPKEGIIIVTFNFATIETRNIGDVTQEISTFSGGTFLDYSPRTGLACFATSLVVCTVSNTSGLAAGTTITIYNIVTFGESSATIDIVSKIYSKVIDSETSVVTQSIAAATVAEILPEAKFLFSSIIKSSYLAYFAKAAYTSTSNSMYADIIVLDNFPSSITVTLKLPISISASIQESSISITTSAFAHGRTNATTTEQFYPTLTEFTSVLVGANFLTATLNADVAASNHISMQIGAGTLTMSKALSLPYFATSVATRYEVLISYTTSTNILKYYSKPFWIGNHEIPLVTVKTSCSSPISPAIPVSLSITSPYAYSPSRGYQAYFQLAFTISGVELIDLGSGLAAGATYPSSLQSGNLILASSSLLYSPLANLTASFVYSFIVPIKTPTAGSESISLTVTLYANRFDGQNFTMATSSTATSGISSVSNITSAEFTSPARLVVGDTGSFFNFGGKEITTPGHIFSTTLIFVLPQGWSFPTGATGKIGVGATIPLAVAALETTGSVVLTILSSTDPALNWNIGYKTAYSSLAGPYAVAQLSNATAPLFTIGETSSLWVSLGKDGSDFTAIVARPIDSCIMSVQGTITVGAAILTSPIYSPLTSEGYGLNVQTVNLEITLTLPVTVSVGSVFSATIGADFGTTGCECTIRSGSFTQRGIAVSDNACTSTSVLLVSAIASGSTVSITVFAVTVPNISIPNTIKAGFTSVTVSSNNNVYISFTDTIAGQGSDSTTRTTFSIGITKLGTSTISSLKVIPNNLGAKAVHLQIKFELSLGVPSGAKLVFTGEMFATDTNTKFTCWLSVGYSAVTVSGASITFTLNKAIPAGYIVEMRKDKAFDVLSSEAAVWLISAGVGASTTNLILDDETTNPHTNKLTYTAAPTASSSGASLTLSINNMYMESWHTFKFIPGVAISSSSFIAFEAPYDYNAHIGIYAVFSALPSYYWLTAKSSVAPKIACSVEHWFVICAGFSSLQSTTTIDVQLFIANPIAISATWNIYVMSLSLSLLANGVSATGTFTALPANNIDLYNITHDLQDAVSSIHKVYVKLSDNYAAGSSIVVRFPYIYNLEVYNPNSVSCQAWFNTSTGTTSLVSSGSNCAVNGNEVVFNISNSAALSGLWTTLQINGVVNPLSGIPRTTGLDVTSKLFDNYNFWSTKFLVYSFIGTASSDTAISSMSYGNLNAGYTGFYRGTWLSLSINGGISLSVTPGTYSKAYSLGVEGVLNAYNLTLVPSDTNDNTLKFDATSYVISIERPVTMFRVGLASSSASGYYFITWTVSESPLSAGVLLYKAPGKTKVSAFLNSQTTIAFSVSSNLTVSAIYGSFPVAVSLAGGVTPFSGLTIGLTISENTTAFYFNPISLSFSPGESIKYFSIKITGSVQNGQFYNVNLTLGGSDAVAFSPAYQLAGFTVGSLYNSSAVTKVYLTSETKTNAVLSLDTNSDGIATWTVHSTSLGQEYNGYDWLVSQAAPVSGTLNENQTTVAQQVEEWNLKISNIDQSDWEAYCLTVLILSDFTVFIGQKFVASGTGHVLASFKDLTADTSYTGAVWFDNLSGKNITFASASVTTATLDDLIQIDLVFTDILASSNDGVIRLSVSQSLSIQSSRVLSFGFLLNHTQNSTKASYLLLPSPTSSTTSEDIFKTLKSTTLFNNLRANGVPVTSAPTFASAQLTRASFGTQALEGAYWNLTNEALPEFSCTVAVAGLVCCAYQVNDTTILTSSQLYSGLNENRDNISDQVVCNEVKEKVYYSFYWNLTDSEIYGNYTFSCTGCNAYPILPTCLGDADIFVTTIEWAKKPPYVKQLAVNFTSSASAYYINQPVVLTAVVFDKFSNAIESTVGVYKIVLLTSPTILSDTSIITSSGVGTLSVRFRNPGFYTVTGKPDTNLIMGTSAPILIMDQISTVRYDKNRLSNFVNTRIRFNVTLVNYYEDLFTYSTTLAFSCSNISDVILDSSSITTSSATAVFYLYFLSGGTKTCNIKSTNGTSTDFFFTIDPMRLNNDTKCISTITNDTCYECVSQALLKDGICYCAPYSTFNAITGVCDCDAGLTFHKDFCTICGNFFNTNELSGSFTADYKSMIIKFARPVNQKDLGSCNSAIILPDIYLGYSYRCYWNNLYTMAIDFSSVVPSGVADVQIDPRLVQVVGSQCNYNISNLTVSVQEVYSKPIPRASIDGPTSISTKCISDGLILKSTYVSSDYKYTWNVVSSSEALANFTAAQNSSYITIPQSLLVAGTLKFTLTVTSISFQSSASAQLSVSSTDTEKFLVDITAGSSLTVYAFDPLTLKSSIIDSCNASTAINLTYSWSYSAVPTDKKFNFAKMTNSERNLTSLIISKGVLSKNIKYIFTVLVKSGNIEGSASITVNVIPHDLVISLDRVSGTINKEKDLEITATAVDPDKECESIPVVWYCTESGNQCTNSAGVGLPTVKSNPTLQIQKDDLKAGAYYNFKATASCKDKANIAVSIIDIYVNEKALGAITFANLEPISSEKSITIIPEVSAAGDPKFLWDIQPSFSGITINQPFIYIPPNTLIPNTVYLVTLTMYSKIVSDGVSAYTNIRVKALPTCTNTTIASKGNDKYKYSIGSCENEEPGNQLSFSYGYIKNNATIWLTGSISFNPVLIKIANFETQGVIKVCSSSNTCKVYTVSIMNKSRTLDADTSDSYELTYEPDLFPPTLIYYMSIADNKTEFDSLYNQYIGHYSNLTIDGANLDVYLETTKKILEGSIIFEFIEISQINGIAELLIQVLENYKELIKDDQLNKIFSIVRVCAGSITSQTALQILEFVSTINIKPKTLGLNINYTDENIVIYRYRNAGYRFGNSTIPLKSDRIQFGNFTLNNTIVYDLLFTKFLEKECNFEFSFYESGIYNSYNYIPSNNYSLISTELDDTIYVNVTGSYDVNKEYDCFYLDDLDWKSGGCTVDIINATFAIVKLAHLSTFRIGLKRMYCDLGEGPIAVMSVLLFLMIILGIILRLYDRYVYEWPSVHCILLYYPLTSLFFRQPKYRRSILVFQILVSELLLLTLIGALSYYFEKPEDDTSNGFHNFYARQLLSGAIALGLTQFFSLPVFFLNALILHKRKGKKRYELIAFPIMTLTTIGCFSGVVIMNNNYCSGWTEYWIISFLVFMSFDFVILEFVYASILACAVPIPVEYSMSRVKESSQKKNSNIADEFTDRINPEEQKFCLSGDILINL